MPVSLFYHLNFDAYASIPIPAVQVSLLRMSQDNFHHVSFGIPPKRLKLLYQVPPTPHTSAVHVCCIHMPYIRISLCDTKKKGHVKVPIISFRPDCHGGKYDRRARKPAVHQIAPFHPKLLHRGLRSSCKPAKREQYHFVYIFPR